MYQPGGGLRTEFKGPSLNTCGRGHRKTRTPWLLWKRNGGWLREIVLSICFLPSFPSFFFLCLRFPYHSPPRFDRVVRKDGWCWRMDRWRSMTREWFVFRDCLSGMLFISNVVQFRYWFDVDLTFKFYGGESNGAIMWMKFTFSRGNSSFVLQRKACHIVSVFPYKRPNFVVRTATPLLIHQRILNGRMNYSSPRPGSISYAC